MFEIENKILQTLCIPMSLFQCSTKQVTTSEVDWPFNVFPFMFISMSFKI